MKKMMNEIIIYETNHGLIKIESHQSSRNTRGKVTETIKGKFSDAIGNIKEIGNSIVEKVKEIKDAPDEISVEIGLKFTAEAGAIIAKTSTEGTIQITITWKK